MVVLLSFRESLDPKRLVPFSLNEFAHRDASTNGGRYSRDLKMLLAGWVDTWTAHHSEEDPFEITPVEGIVLKKRVAAEIAPKEGGESVLTEWVSTVRGDQCPAR